MTNQEVFDNFILSRRLADLSEKTISAYEQFVTPFLAFVGPAKTFESLTQTDINNYLSVLISRPVSKATKATHIRHIKAFLHWAGDEYISQYSYKAIKVPRTPKKEVRIYLDDEVRAIFWAVSTESDWLTLRNKTIIAMMYDSGLRQSEVCGLKKSWIYPTGNRMKVYGKGSKERIVPLGELTKELLRRYFQACPYSSEYVFLSNAGERLSCNAVKLMISKASDKLGFELSSHKLRHNFATNYCIDQYHEKGQVDIFSLMILMGHEDIKTTQRYLHYAMELLASENNISHLDKLGLIS